MKTVVDAGFACMEKIALSVLICFATVSFASAQVKNMEDKIDPEFRNIIEKVNGKNCYRYFDASTSSKLKKNKVKIADTAADKKKYDCIVYTKNAKAIKEKGIIVNSVLPGFLTASATLCQIMQMASMPEVIKIEAPQINKAH